MWAASPRAAACASSDTGQSQTSRRHHGDAVRAASKQCCDVVGALEGSLGQARRVIPATVEVSSAFRPFACLAWSPGVRTTSCVV